MLIFVIADIENYSDERKFSGKKPLKFSENKSSLKPLKAIQKDIATIWMRCWP